MSEKINVSTMIDRQRDLFLTHKTLDYSYRLSSLKRLKKTILKYEEEVYDALKSDLNKSKYEANMTEVGLILGELDKTIKHLSKWMKPKRLRVSFTQMPAKSRLLSEPYGVVLIMSPWNYPFQLTMAPLIGAVAAGNCVMVKPSAYSPKTSDVFVKIIKEAFEDFHVEVITGGREENKELLDQKFDYIFFTGSPVVGKIVMQHAANNLTPVTLELGGKSPCIVDKNTDLKKTAKRLLFGKLLNSGQTCIAPDYLFIHEAVKEDFVKLLIQGHKEMLSDKVYVEKNFPRIINDKHYNRIRSLLEGVDVLYGGDFNEELRQISFTLVDNPPLDSRIMNEEIFAPILPIITWKNKEEVVQFLNARPKPLALYLFTKDASVEEYIVKNVSYGGGCINDTIIHIAGQQPFGGVGNSGIGAYHGKKSFETFSHYKHVIKKSWYFDLPIRYHPYKNVNKKINKFLFK